MKHPVLALLGLLAVAAAPIAQAVEILRWERMPLAVPLKVGQERIVFIDRNVRVGVPAGVGERLRVQSAGGAVYLRAISRPVPAAAGSWRLAAGSRPRCLRWSGCQRTGALAPAPLPALAVCLPFSTAA